MHARTYASTRCVGTCMNVWVCSFKHAVPIAHARANVRMHARTQLERSLTLYPSQRRDVAAFDGGAATRQLASAPTELVLTGSRDSHDGWPKRHVPRDMYDSKHMQQGYYGNQLDRFKRPKLFVCDMCRKSVNKHLHEDHEEVEYLRYVLKMYRAKLSFAHKRESELERHLEHYKALAEKHQHKEAIMFYTARVRTGAMKNGGATGGARVWLTMVGERGTSTEFLLGPSDVHRIALARAHVDEFRVQAVDIGRVHRIIIRYSKHSRADAGRKLVSHDDATSTWYVEDVVIVHENGQRDSFFAARTWLSPSETSEIELDAAAASETMELLVVM